MATYHIIYRSVQCEERDESYSNIAGHEGLMKFSPSRGFRSTTVHPSLISNPPQLKFFTTPLIRPKRNPCADFVTRNEVHKHEGMQSNDGSVERLRSQLDKTRTRQKYHRDVAEKHYQNHSNDNTTPEEYI